MDHTLRLYDNPFKQSFYLLISLGFVIAGMLLLRDPKFSAGAPNVVMAYLDIGFFGLGSVVFLYSTARDLAMAARLSEAADHTAGRSRSVGCRTGSWRRGRH